jgi:hypothetical protein
VPASAVRSRIRNIEHHRSHLASAFSPLLSRRRPCSPSTAPAISRPP